MSSDGVAGWSYPELGRGATRQGDIPTKHALDESTKTFVREVLQNANDAGLDGECVEVIFDFELLTGEELREFKNLLQWEALVEDHLRPAGEESSDLGVDRYLRQVDERDELLLLTVEDRNTEGLTGSEDAENSNYTALVRDILRSHKEDETAGGSHGVGKTVLWAFSGVSTVLFNSVPVDDGDTAGGDPPRLVGRSILPDHVAPDGTLYSGNGWFGIEAEDEGIERHVSMWSDEAAEFASRLGVGRPRIQGTSATVVGFRDPSGEFDTDVDADVLAAEFERAAIRWFWPAMLENDLAVYIDGPGDDPLHEVEPDALPEVRPFVECYRKGREAPSTFDAPGTVARRDIPWEIPDEADGTPTEDGEVTLLVRAQAPADSEERVNEVATFRGARMVVEYLDKTDLSKYGTNFYAVLIGGEARDSFGVDIGRADRGIEEFLRAAEPAAHDEWKDSKNRRLRSRYKQGWGKALKRLKGELLEGELDDLVGRDDDPTDGRLERLSALMPRTSVGEGPSDGAGDDPFEWIDGPHVFFDGDRWEFTGSVEATDPDHDGWTATIDLKRRGDEGTSAGDLAIASFDASGIDWTVDDGAVSIDVGGGVGEISFEGHSSELESLDPYSGEYGRVELRFVGDVTGGGDEA